MCLVRRTRHHTANGLNQTRTVTKESVVKNTISGWDGCKKELLEQPA
jgi:hypothetical protein